MAKKNSSPHPWRIYARRFDKKHPNAPKDRLLELPEQQSILGMRKRVQKPIAKPSTIDLESFGYPIDANQAIHFMINAFTATSNLFDKLINFKSMEFTKAENKFIMDAIGLPYGITFDKTLVLKILSQPNCEGLRSYLCKRDNGHVSLVLIGVDCDGYDLNYEVVPEGNVSLKDINVVTQSLSVEYGHPPDTKNYKEKSQDEHYILLNYANP